MACREQLRVAQFPPLLREVGPRQDLNFLATLLWLDVTTFQGAFEIIRSALKPPQCTRARTRNRQHIRTRAFSIVARPPPPRPERLDQNRHGWELQRKFL